MSLSWGLRMHHVRRAAALIALVFLPFAAHAASLNEIRIDQPSTDNDEYVELAGAPGELLNGLSFVVIGDGTGGSGVVEAVVDLGGQAVAPSGFFVVAEGTFTLGTADLTASLNFENSDNVTHLLIRDFTGANGDDLDTDDDGTFDLTPWTAIEDCLALIETVGTGELTYCATTNGPDGTFVPGHSINCPGGWVTGAFDPTGGDDTPGAANTCPGPDPVTLSEIRIDQPSNDDDEYVELMGTAGASLDGLTYLVIGDGTGGSGVIESVTDLTGSVVPASGFFVAAESTFTLGTADLTASLNFENSDNVTHLLVRDFTGANGDDLDTDDDGTFDTTPWTALEDCLALVETVGSGELTYCATTNGPDGTFVPSHSFLCDDGWRTGAFDPTGGDDTPGAANACAPAATAALSEIRIDQPSDDDDEYVELTGPAGGTLDGLTYVVIGDGTGGSGVVESVTDLTGSSLDAGGFFVAAEATFTLGTANLTTSLDFENSDNVTHLLVRDFTGTSGDDLDTDDDGTLDVVPWSELVDCLALIETVGSGDLTYCGTTNGPDGTFVPSHSILCPAGWQTGAFDPTGGDDTPGAANSCPAPAVVINEIDYDQPSTDTAEFIELVNTGATPVDLDAFALELVNGNGGAVYQSVDLPAVSLAAGDFYVVCSDATTVGGCDLAVLNSIQNGAPDAVALTFAGGIVDTVSYEGDTVAPYTEGSGAGLQDPGTTGNDNLSIGRLPDGLDTDQNNVDFSTRCATPGAPNSSDATGCPGIGPAILVVNEIDYDQPSSDTAEFVEITNIGTGTADLNGVDLVLVNGNGGAPYQTIALPAMTLAAGDFFVVCADAATVANCDLDAISSIQNGAPDAVALVAGTTVLDTVSYEGDTAAPYTEGSGSGLEDSGATGEDNKSIGRFPNGADTNQNNVDLGAACITPGAPNTSIATGCTPIGPAFEIWEIQGNGLASPFDGQTVTMIDNVVTAVGTDRFFIQTPAARTDGDPETSDGVMVFTGGAPTVAVGDVVTVTGLVDEFFDLTEITGTPSVTVTASGAALPAAVIFDATTPSPTQPQAANEVERYEGMLVLFDGIASGPSDRFGDVAVTTQASRAYREPGIEFPGLPALPVWDGNPELFEIDPDGLGGPDAAIFAGQAVAAEGPLTFSFGDYQVLPTTLVLGPEPVNPRPVRDPMPGELTIASQNMLRLFDDVDDGIGEPVPTTAEFQDALGKFSLHFRDVMKAPDVIAFQEVENLNVLQQLAARITADDPSLVYAAHLLEGNDVGGIDVGYLTRTDTVTVGSVTQFGAALTLSFDGSLLFDRPPLVLEATYTGAGGAFPFTAVVVHQRSLSGIDGSGSSATRVKTKRLEQAQETANLVQSLQTTDPAINLVVLGDFNGFQFTDGFVDVVGVVAGDLDPAGAEFPGTDVVDPNLDNQVLSLPAEERYSFVFGGSAQALDHALTSSALSPLVSDFAFARGNADAPDALMADPTTPLRVSDHDGLVLFVQTVLDEDGDGVADGADLCPGTAIPEDVPTVRLGVFRYALTDADMVFDTRVPRWFPHQPPSFDTADTGGCSCEQIIDTLHLGSFSTKYGCGLFLMKFWAYWVSTEGTKPPPFDRQ